MTDEEIKKEIEAISDEELCSRIKGIEVAVKDATVMEGGPDGYPVASLDKRKKVLRDPQGVLQWLKEEKNRRVSKRRKKKKYEG